MSDLIRATGWPPAAMARRSVEVLGSHLSYVVGGAEAGEARTLLFVHGNPTSSFLWRRVVPALLPSFRCIAVDLIGMGASSKPALDYGFADHARYLEEFADRMGLRAVTLIGHDWGAVLGLDLIRRRPDVAAAIAVCEGHLHPFDSWDDMDAGSRSLFGMLRTPGVGERMVLDENFFVEEVLPAGMTHSLTADEWDAYLAPFASPSDRLPVLRWIQQIPIADDPPDVARIVLQNQDFLLRGSAPRLLLHGDPGAVVGPGEVAWCRQEGGGLRIRSVGPGTHFLPEDQPEAIAREIDDWLRSIG